MLPARPLLTVALGCSLLLVGCAEEGPEPSAAVASAAPAWVLASAPGGAVGVLDAKSASNEGDTVVLRGTIGGVMDPMSADSPVIRIIDSGLFNRCTEEKDHCPTPWDYCCADPDDVADHSATIQLVGTDGAAVNDSAANHGFAPLDEVIVVGTVQPRPSEQVLTVKATGIYRVGG